MRLSEDDVQKLPLAAALYDSEGGIVCGTPEWQGVSPGVVRYATGTGALLVAPGGGNPDLDVVALELVGELFEVGRNLGGRDAVAVDMIAAGLELVLGRIALNQESGSLDALLRYVTEGVRRSVTGCELEIAPPAWDGLVPMPAAVALAIVQMVRNAAAHRQVRHVGLSVVDGPTFRVEWADPTLRHALNTSRREELRARWGAGYARLLADALGGVLTAPVSLAEGSLTSTLGLGAARLSLPLAVSVDGRIARATRAWDEETGLPPGAPVDLRASLAAEAAVAAPGSIVYSDVLRARACGRETWLVVAPPTSLARVRDLVRGIRHENALLTAPEPRATHIYALTALLEAAAFGEAVPDVSGATWRRDFPVACGALEVKRTPGVPADLLRYPDPRLAAFLLAALDGSVGVSADGRVVVKPSPALGLHPIVRMFRSKPGLVPLEA